VKLKIIRDEKTFYSLKEKWNNLLECSDSRSIFLTWEWLYTWWKIYSEDRELFIIVSYDENELVAIFPLLRRKIKILGIYEQFILEFLGTGEEEKDEVCSNFMELIVRPDIERSNIYNAVFSFLVEQLFKEWDYIVLKSVRADSAFAKAIITFFNTNNCLVQVAKNFTNGATILDGGWNDFIKSLGQRTRKRIKRERKLLESMSGFKYRFLKNENEFEVMFDTFVKLSLKRWNNGGAFSSQKFLNFQKNVCREFFEKGYLKLSLMEVDGKIVAGNLDYFYKDTVYGYQTAFDPEFNPKIGIGTLGMVYCIEAAVREGFKRYDWYKTVSGSYKEHFVNYLEDIIDLKVMKKSIIPYSELFLNKAKKTIKNYVNYR
jgi:hypothetical protein